jgi:riboflavin-specific deaminase-like protein
MIGARHPSEENVTEPSLRTIGEDCAWQAILAASRAAREGTPSGIAATYRTDDGGNLQRTAADGPDRVLRWTPAEGWCLAHGLDGPGAALLDLYLPMCTDGAGLTVAHLGQSLDGCIALESGDSCYVTGPQNILHLHRMRALSDAVLVGAETVAMDDPQLTTRQVPGPHPARVILDPGRRLGPHHRVFADGEARTLVLCTREHLPEGSMRIGKAELVGVAASGERLDLRAALATLRERGLRIVFVEGGGVTVSSLLEAGLLDRLQVTVATLVIGDGRPGLRVPSPPRLSECLRPSARVFRMGNDILFDCDLRPGAPQRRATPTLDRVL